MGTASELTFPPLIDDHADHRIIEGLDEWHMFDGIHGCCFRGNDVELFLKQAYLIAEIREIAVDETDIDRIVDQIL